MAKNVFEEKKIIKLVGTLDKNENGDFICTVEDKDRVEEFNVVELLDQMVGTEISLQSIDDIS